MRSLFSYALVASVPMILGLAGCGDTTTTEVVKEVVPPCSPTQPQGACDAGQSCVEGACVATSSLCSTTNLEGTCTSGMTCFAGGCVLETALCSADNPTGACNIGSTCNQGACVATASLCSSANPSGTCPSGQTCQGGMCVGELAIPCEQQVYTQQPEIVVHASATLPQTVIQDEGGNDICVPIDDPRVPITGLVWEGATRGTITVDGLQFKDSNGNGTLDPYEDWRLLEICRARDLVSKMSLDEKLGQMGEGSRFGSNGTSQDCAPADGEADQLVPTNRLDDLVELHRRPALIRTGQSGPLYARYLNNLNEVAEGLPLGIPIIITADPIHGLRMQTTTGGGRGGGTPGAQILSPESTTVSDFPIRWGFGAINDRTVTREAGDIIRKEFMAMGFRWQLGPMADSSTEPRWARNQSTFSENPLRAAVHTQAWISGFQNYGCQDEEQCLRGGIAATMKHFPGAGPDERGMDSHSYPGRYNVFPGNNLVQHLIPFQAAIDVGVASVMPCYSVFKDQLAYDPDQVPSGFGRHLITDILKTQMGFTGMITSDWGTSGHDYGNNAGLSTAQRAANWLKAGSDQWGSDDVELFRAALNQGLVDQSHIDGAVAKIMEMSFKLGLFENPYVDEAAAGQIVRSQENMLFGFNAQKRAIVMLKNATVATRVGLLPIVGDANHDSDGSGEVAVYFDGIHDSPGGLVSQPPATPGDPYYDPYVVDNSGAAFVGEYDYTSPAADPLLAVVEAPTIEEADIAILRIGARQGQYFGLDDGVPLSFDGPFPGTGSDGGLGPALLERNRVVDAFRVRDGYMGCNAGGTALEAVPAANPDLRIALVLYADRAAIVKGFVDGLKPEALNDVM
ncbi:MAG: glycoside hydrolase family 3 N-terminal domain-containing protein, partial [Polyangiales bacterium]